MISEPKEKNAIILIFFGANIMVVDSKEYCDRLNWVGHVKCIYRKSAKVVGISIKHASIINMRRTPMRQSQKSRIGVGQVWDKRRD